jgi:GT2 family glycosyltransferase
MMRERSTPGVSIVIVCWNSAAYLPRCLQSLVDQTYRDFEVIVVDNGSADGAPVALPLRYPGLVLRIVHLESNLGFAAANNLGADLARGPWLALLSPDAFPEPDWLENLLQTAEGHPDFAAFSSRQIQDGNPRLLDGAGDAYHVSGLAWPRFVGYPCEDYGLEPMEVFSPCAAAALYKRDAFLAVGGFDVDFFAYFEDVDLGFRLRLHGHRTWFSPNAVVHHIGSATFGRRSHFALYHSHRNLVWTFIKNMPAPMLWKYLPAHLLANLLHMTYYSLRVPGIGQAIWRAKWDAIRGLRRALDKRARIQRYSRVSVPELERVMEHGFLQPYLLGYKLRRIMPAPDPPGRAGQP